MIGAHRIDVRRGTHERQRHHVGADVEREPQIDQILGRERRRGDVHPGQIQAFMIGYEAALDDAAPNLTPIGTDDVQAHHPLVDQDHVAGADVARELRVRGRRPLGRSDNRLGRDDEVVAGREPGAPIAEHTETNPGTLQICEDRHEATGGAFRVPHLGAQLAMSFVSSVGEIEACYIHSGAHQRLHLLRGRRRGPEGAHHLHPARVGRRAHELWLVSRSWPSRVATSNISRLLIRHSDLCTDGANTGGCHRCTSVGEKLVEARQWARTNCRSRLAT